MFKSISEFLLNFKPGQFEEVNIVFQAAKNPLVWILLLLIVSAILKIYSSTNRYTSNKIRYVSLALKACALLLLCIPILEPVLLIPNVIPNENFVVILADNSASMGIQDGYFGDTRYSDIRTLISDDQKGILKELKKDFMVRMYHFNNNASRIDTLSNFDIKGWQTNLSASLQQVLSDFKGLPLSGIILLSDGGDNSTGDLKSNTSKLLNSSFPLHIVGLGREYLEKDYELLNVKTNKGLQEGTGAEIEIKARSWQKDNSIANLNIYEGEKLVYSKKVNLKGKGKTDQFSFFFNHDKKIKVEYTVHLSPLPEETNLENNSLNILVDPKKDSIRVLYFQGHPLTEFKFIKRALEKDQVVDFTSISRTGTGKFYRQGIRTSDELKGGFPTSEEELYQFKGIILGDVEAGYFSLDQLKKIEKFVSKRGGGFLMLGGKNSFSEGDYWNTPIEDMLPVELDPSRRMILQPDFKNSNIPKEEQGFKFTPTREGLEHSVLKLSTDVLQNKVFWDELPTLFSLNLFGPVKPGAVVLAEKPKDHFGAPEPILVIERYGSGRTAALATASTWRWKMLQDAQDTRHEHFWRQLIRWLSKNAPDPVNLDLTQDRFVTDTEIPLRVTVYDKNYDPLNFAKVSGTITDPSGAIHKTTFLPELSNEGEYIATFFPKQSGIDSINVEAKIEDQLVGKLGKNFLSRHSKQEYYNATLKKNFLQNLAQISGGRYYNPEQAADIPSHLKSRQTNRSILTSEYAWDMPLLFLMIISILSAEWIYRRQKGLP